MNRPHPVRNRSVASLSLAALLIASTAWSLDERQTLGLLVQTIEKTQDSAVQASLLKGMLRGLEGRRDVGVPDGWPELSKRLASSDEESIRNGVDRLSQIFGDRAAIERAMEVVIDDFAPMKARQEALRSLIAQQHSELSRDLENLLKVDELKQLAIRAYGVLETDDAPQILLSRYEEESADVRRIIIETLATRKPYAKALVRALKNGPVDREAIPSYLARSLRDILGQEFTDVYGEIPELKKDTGETIAKFKRLITESALDQADAGRGRSVFKKTCGACHTLYGVGGKIGPDLTGSNRANLDYFLLNSVDPSADVPEGYRTQLIQTVDGRLLTGVLAEEDNQRVVLKTVDQPRVVIAKDDIEARKVSPKSMMPEGQLDQLKKKDLFDLVKYMQTKTQVEAAQ